MSNFDQFLRPSDFDFGAVVVRCVLGRKKVDCRFAPKHPMYAPKP